MELDLHLRFPAMAQHLLVHLFQKYLPHTFKWKLNLTKFNKKIIIKILIENINKKY
jgi:hypothetical protein